MTRVPCVIRNRRAFSEACKHPFDTAPSAPPWIAIRVPDPLHVVRGRSWCAARPARRE